MLKVFIGVEGVETCLYPRCYKAVNNGEMIQYKQICLVVGNPKLRTILYTLGVPMIGPIHA